MPFQVFFLDDFRAACRIFSFHYFELRMLIQKITALHQGDRVGVDFCQVFPAFFGQADEAMWDAQLVFADNLRTALSQQFIVVQQASRYRIFDG